MYILKAKTTHLPPGSLYSPGVAQLLQTRDQEKPFQEKKSDQLKRKPILIAASPTDAQNNLQESTKSMSSILRIEVFSLLIQIQVDHQIFLQKPQNLERTTGQFREKRLCRKKEKP